LDGDAPQGLCPECLLHQAIQAPDGSDSGSDLSGTSAYTADFVPPSPAELAPHFPQLEVLELLGKGGMGAVYKARQPRLDRLVALKVLPPEAGRDPAFAERFTREARALARLNHAQIVSVHDFGETAGLYYFIMEYVDGVNLRHLLTNGELTPAQTLPIVVQVCEALQFAHDEGIVHRDIKPENILLDKKGRVKIADFGLAKLLGQTGGPWRLTGTCQVMGTPHYMAPEQLEKPLGVDHRADIFSVGVVFYEMLTGELPLGHFALPSQKVAVDARLDEVVLRALEKEPDNRYQHVSELEKEVATIKSQSTGGDARTSKSGRRSGARLVSVPFWVQGSVFTINGLIRLEGHRLALEYEAPRWFKQPRLKETAVPLRDLNSILFKKNRLILTAHRMSVLRDIPGSRPGHAELMIAHPHRKTAERLATVVQEYLDAEEADLGDEEMSGEPLSVLFSEMQKTGKPFLGRVKALFQSVLYYCVDTFHGRRSAPRQLPPPPGDGQPPKST
jgi:predicted Ser/Thr protein kinase